MHGASPRVIWGQETSHSQWWATARCVSSREKTENLKKPWALTASSPPLSLGMESSLPRPHRSCFSSRALWGEPRYHVAARQVSQQCHPVPCSGVLGKWQVQVPTDPLSISPSVKKKKENKTKDQIRSVAFTSCSLESQSSRELSLGWSWFC